MTDVPSTVASESGLETFVKTARELLQSRVRDCWVDKPWGGDPGPNSIDADAYAYEAAVMLRAKGLSWLPVKASSTQEPRYVNTSSLGSILGIVDASPFLGEDMLAEILPPRR